MAIHFFFQKPAHSLRNRKVLKDFIISLFKKEKQPLESLAYIFCSDDELLKINRQFLNHDYYTDIITFNHALANQAVVGEIYISIDRVKENAAEWKASLQEELHRVIFHGALHLCGYGDKTKTEKAEMEKMENLYLSRYSTFHESQFR